MTLLQLNKDRTTLVDELFDAFKLHLRILHDVEDASIRLYLAGAIDGIERYAGNDIFLSQYSVFYPEKSVYEGGSTPSSWYCGKWDISGMTIINSAGVDVTGDYTIDTLHGMVYPHPLNKQITFYAGFATEADMPPHLKTIIFRYGAHLFENRESVRVGEPKMLPDWVQYAMASIWKPRI